MEFEPGKSKRAVLVLVVENGNVYLPLKKEKFCAGMHIGIGGGIEGNETEREAAVREFWEETPEGCSINSYDLEHVAICHFYNHLMHRRNDNTACHVIVDVFICRRYQGQLDPDGWFEINKLPIHKMPPADMFWMPDVLITPPRKMWVEAHYGPNQRALVHQVRLRPLFSTKEEALAGR
jgi:8-oxo-dGTP pyrophosphatase MutT (NUDIX family)